MKRRRQTSSLTMKKGDECDNRNELRVGMGAGHRHNLSDHCTDLRDREVETVMLRKYWYTTPEGHSRTVIFKGKDEADCADAVANMMAKLKCTITKSETLNGTESVKEAKAEAQ